MSASWFAGNSGCNRDELMDLVNNLSRQRLEFDESRRELTLQLSAKRDELRQTQDRLHQAEMRTEQIMMQREQLAERMQDDYGIDLADRRRSTDRRRAGTAGADRC